MDEKYISKYETGRAVDQALDYGVQAKYEIETAKGSTHETLDSVIDDLQEQINQIVRAPESGGDVAAEVAQARVGADSTVYSTLKDRLDDEYAYSVLNRNIITDISKPCLNKVLANIWNTNLSMSNYTFVDYRGYGYLCNIPDYICGIRLNLRIKSSDDGDQLVPITISIRDKNTREVLWSLSKSYYISFTSQYGYVRNDLIIFDKVLVGLPVEAYFVIDVGTNYTLAVTPRSWDATEYISEDLLKIDTNYKTWYLDTNGSPVVSPANAYYCDFSFYKGDVSTLSIEDVDNKIELESTKNKTNTQIIRRVLNPISTPPVRTRVFNTEDNDAETSYGYNSFRGYGYYCHIPEFLNGIYLNLKIYGNGTNVSVPITVSILDKDTHEFLWTVSKEYTLTFNNNYAYIDHETFMFNEHIYGLPETAYVFISVSNPYKLVVVKDPPAAIVNTTLFIPDDYYHTLFYNNDDDIQIGSSSYYLCDFALYSAEITDKRISTLSSKITAIKNSFQENYDIIRGFNRDFALTTNTYGFTDYRGYGYLINSPKTFGGIWVNIIITPDNSFEQDYTKDISIFISLRDKDTKSVIYEYSKTCEVTFTASTGVGTLSRFSIYTNEPVTDLPSQCYLCIAVPIGYRLNVTTNDSSEKFTPLLTLDENYKNLYLANNQKYIVSAGLYKYTCDIGVYDISYINDIKNNDRIYNIHDAFLNWNKGEKFPVAFAGDSTTDGSRTTNYTPNVLGTDHTTGYLYTDILQTYLRNELNNNVLRIYNAGFSGKTIAWMLSNFDAEFGSDSAYADVKMIGVSFGINDRPNTEETYRTFKNNVITFCKKCLSKGIQPFLLTSQAGAENSENLNRYEYKTISFANKAKKEVSNELNLEIIDVSTITANFLKYSNRPIQTILYDYCHFGDYGHKFEAGMFFKEFIPRVINIENDDKLVFESQGIKSDLQWGDQPLKQVQMLSEITNGFKTAAVVSGRTDTSDIVVMDAWVFISGKNPLDLTLYTSAVNTLYCVIDDSSTPITSTTQNLGTFDLGLHHIVVKSGNSSNINFYGIKFVKSTS